MKKIAALLLSSVILSGCLPIKSPAPSASNPALQGNQPFSGALKAAVDLGVPMKCTYTEEGDKTGTGYIKGGKFYGENDTDKGKGFTIVKDNCFWSWSENQTEGVSLCMKPEDLPNASAGDQSIWDSKDVDTPDTDVTCNVAVVDDAMFNPPANIKFTDLSDLMKDVDKQVEEMMKNFGEDSTNDQPQL